MATRSIKHPSRTGDKPEEIEGCVNDHFDALDEMVTCRMSIIDPDSRNGEKYDPK
jgi:hypothetical protein